MSKVVFLLMVAATVVLYDSMATLVSRALQIDYSYFGVGSLAIYFLAGFFGSKRFRFVIGVLAGLVAGLTDSTVGLFVSELIGPYTFEAFDFASLSAEDIVYIIAFVSIQSTILGSFGSLVAYLLWGKE